MEEKHSGLDTGLIYYISKNAIDQLYRSRFGPLIDEEEHVQSKEKAEGLTAKLGLDKLLAVLSGVTLSAEGKLDNKTTEGNKEKFKHMSEDRALVLLNNIFISGRVPNIKEILGHNELRSLYTFSCPVKLEEKFKPKGDGTLLQVVHSSGNLRFSGITSIDNWLSPSLLNNLLYNSSGIFNAAGVLSPLQGTKNDKAISLTVQYLIICQPVLFKKI